LWLQKPASVNSVLVFSGFFAAQCDDESSNKKGGAFSDAPPFGSGSVNRG